jgi:NAD(P)-dependent dehydrogenase (short-subunit alcohol dehydrogenase family)
MPKELEAGVKAIGTHVSGVRADVANRADLDRFYEIVSKTKERIDIVFANPGVGEFVPFGSVTGSAFRQVVQHQCKGNAVYGAKGIERSCKDGGSIILNGSTANIKGTPAFGVYAASKAAIGSFVRSWTSDLKHRRIRSNVVSPGPIETSLTNRLPADAVARIVSTIPIGRMGKPDEIAKAAWFLASDDSSFVTGIELFVDGGRAQI